jgi:hypothetical protein
LSSRGIFLSYRRADAAPYARLLQFQFRERFPDARVFMDLDSIEAGLDFREVIQEAVSSCAVLVALIGRQWMTLTDGKGRRRLDNPDDLVRFEVQAALERGVRVIPVLVDGAAPPQEEELPSELHKLARLNALELGYSRYEYDADRLLDLIQQVLAARVVPSREVDAGLALRLREEIEPFHGYLVALGLVPHEREPPQIGLQPDSPGSMYNPNTHRIEISPDFADYPHVWFREYCNYALTPDEESYDFAIAAYELKSGLGFYLPCSFTGNPAGFAPFGVYLNDPRKMVKRRGDPSPASQDRAFIWASIFWEARQLGDPGAEDKMVAAAWLATVAASQQKRQVTYRAVEELFAQQLLGLAPSCLASEQCQSLTALLRRRGVL